MTMGANTSYMRFCCRIDMQQYGGMNDRTVPYVASRNLSAKLLGFSDPMQRTLGVTRTDQGGHIRLGIQRIA